MVRDQDRDRRKTAETKTETTKIGLETYSPGNYITQDVSCFGDAAMQIADTLGVSRCIVLLFLYRFFALISILAIFSDHHKH